MIFALSDLPRAFRARTEKGEVTEILLLRDHTKSVCIIKSNNQDFEMKKGNEIKMKTSELEDGPRQLSNNREPV